MNAVVYNVFNIDFVRYLPYGDAGRTLYAQRYANNQEPRRLYLSVAADF